MENNREKEYLYIILHIPKTGGETIKKHIVENMKHGEYLILDYERNSKLELRKNVDKYLAYMGNKEKNKIKVIIGHKVYYGLHKFFQKKPRYITFLRNPYDLTVSKYNFIKTKLKDKLFKDNVIYFKLRRFIKNENLSDLTLKEFVNKKDEVNNLIVKSIINNGISLKEVISDKRFKKQIDTNHLNKTKKILKNFYFIGLTEEKNDYLFVYGLLNIKVFFNNQNISKKYFLINKSKDFEQIKKIIRIKNREDFAIYKFGKMVNKKFKINTKKYYKNEVNKIIIKKYFKFPIWKTKQFFYKFFQ